MPVSENAREATASSTASGAPPPLSDSRRSSIASIRFTPTHPTLPQGVPRRKGERRRDGSPMHPRFEHRVAFNSLGNTKHGIPTCMLSVKHHGYHATRTSRLVMVGVDEHTYSNGALEWVLKEYVDDGDTVVCVRVVEKDLRSVNDRAFQEEAKDLMERIKEKSAGGRAIEIILEVAVGKLNESFQKLIQMYHPSMLVVGTKGRSLGGFQGLMNARNSFSKYCLQYSPIPVVVVRPDEARLLKRQKRRDDPERRIYARMLAYNNNGTHESDAMPAGLDVMEAKLSADEEAHRVATAIGLSAAFDPTVKPIRDPFGRRKSSLSQTSNVSTSPPPPSSTAGDEGDETRSVRSESVVAPSDLGSGDEEVSGEEDDDEEVGARFEAVPGDHLRASIGSSMVDEASGEEASEEESGEEQEAQRKQQGRIPILTRVSSSSQAKGLDDTEKKERLHKMEVGEGAALLKNKPKLDEEDEDDD